MAKKRTRKSDATKLTSFKPDILTKQERADIAKARLRARTKGQIIKVGAYERRMYYLKGIEARNARWEDAERAIWRLVSNRLRSGPKQGDTDKARALVAALESVFFNANTHR